MGHHQQPFIFGVDESGTSPMYCVATFSLDPASVERSTDYSGNGILEKRFNRRILSDLDEQPEYIENGGGYKRRVVADNLPNAFGYATLTNSSGKPPPNKYRIRVIANILHGIGIREYDRVFIDAFCSPTVIASGLTEELRSLGIELPAGNIAAEPHADEIYPLVNDADYTAHTLFHSRNGMFNGHRVRIDLRRHKKAA